MNKKMYLMASKDWTAADIKAEKLTHLLVSFARIGNSFQITDFDERVNAGDKNDCPLPDYISASIISAEKWNEVKKLKAANPQLKVISAIGGWAAEGFSDMAATPVTRRIFADSVVKYVEAHSLDGVDIDWEFPTTAGRSLIKVRPQDKENYTALLKELRESLGTNKEITFCASSGEWFMDSIELYEMARYANSIHIMTYDMAGTWDTEARHHTNLYTSPLDPYEYKSQSVERSVTQYIQSGIPPEMLTIGYASYGREFRGTAAGDKNGLYQKFVSKDPHVWRGGTIDYSMLEKYYINKNGYTRYWDEYSSAPYLYSETEKNFITYDDCESVAAKARYAKENNLGGIMCWEYLCDREAVLLNALS